MKLHQTTTEFNCGIDLHKQNMYICLVNRNGDKLVHRNIKHNDFDFFLKVVQPYRHDLTVACESTFNWYWLSDACIGAGLPFVLGHALYMRAIHGTKSKNDRVDSEKIAHLLRTNLLPVGHTCRAEIRPVRDLMRRRIHFVRQRASILGHMTSAAFVDGIEWLTCEEKRRANRQEMVPKKFEHPMRKMSLEADTWLAEQYDQIISKLDWQLAQYTRKENSYAFNILQTVPGIGKTCAMIILYEIDTIDRFKTVRDFCSYCRLFTPLASSDGKVYGVQGRKIGNPYLKWVFSEIAVHTKRFCSPMNQYFVTLEKRYGKQKAYRIMCHRIGRAVYFMLKRNVPFDLDKFLKNDRKTETQKIEKKTREMAISS